jgi:excinuclease UvrABC ATPase subunit
MDVRDRHPTQSRARRGKITAAGTPEQVSKSKVSRTAPFLG